MRPIQYSPLPFPTAQQPRPPLSINLASRPDLWRTPWMMAPAGSPCGRSQRGTEARDTTRRLRNWVEPIGVPLVPSGCSLLTPRTSTHERSCVIVGIWIRNGADAQHAWPQLNNWSRDWHRERDGCISENILQTTKVKIGYRPKSAEPAIRNSRGGNVQ